MSRLDWVIVLATSYCLAIAMLVVGVPQINAWEKAHAYPYGQMCNSVFTGYQDTCPSHAR